LYSAPDIFRILKSRRMIGASHVPYLGETVKSYKTFVGKPEEKRQLGRPRLRWEDNINMDLREIGWGGGVWTGYTWLRIRTSGVILSTR
jgi:hypothetical protein